MKDNGKAEDNRKDDLIEIDEPSKTSKKIKPETPPKSLASIINRKSGVHTMKNKISIDKMDIDEKPR